MTALYKPNGSLSTRKNAMPSILLYLHKETQGEQFVYFNNNRKRPFTPYRFPTTFLHYHGYIFHQSDRYH